ncbi:MAG: hypothetical protein H6883_07590 [Rhodobiaceae bacterium]|nr:hypothetical protein [Rhodobiaceae bacterium]MCC0055983.1 hypothetical protein [Rhodobiaceae bacterium]
MLDKSRQKTLTDRPIAQTIACIAIGTILFLIFMGPSVLVPTNIGWMQHADGEQHYLGWAFYRHEPWAFPPGKSVRFGLELGGSVVYADAIPLLAIPFKLLSPALPEPFQYYGIWILACFVLQAVFSWLLIGLFTANPAHRLLAATLLAAAPVMLWRLHPFIRHESLMAHFLIIWSLWLCLKPLGRRHLAGWCGLLAAATLIHAYLLAMVLALFLADTVDRKRSRELALSGIATSVGAGVIAVLLPAWLAGYFEIGGDATASAFGAYGIMGDGTFPQIPLSFLQSAWGDYGRWSYLLPEMPVHYSHHEGFVYLGAGALLCLLCTIVLAPTALIPDVAFLRRHLMAALAVAALTFFAIIKIGTLIAMQKAFAFIPAGDQLYEALFRYGSMFRANARFAWPLCYLIILFALVALTRTRRPALTAGLLASALALQVVDTSPGWRVIRDSVNTAPRTSFSTRLKDPFWEDAASRYAAIRRLPSKNTPARWRDIADLADRHRIGTNMAYLSRVNADGLASGRIETLEDLERNVSDRSTLYVIGEELPDAMREALMARGGYHGTVDGITVYAPDWDAR